MENMGRLVRLDQVSPYRHRGRPLHLPRPKANGHRPKANGHRLKADGPWLKADG